MRWLFGALLLAGCGRGSTVVGIGTRPDQPPEPGTDTAEDTGEPVATGSLRITYAFGTNDIGVARCADAGIETLSLRFANSTSDVGPWGYPCVDDELRAGELPEGQWNVILEGEMPSGALFGTWKTIRVTADESTDVSLVLECDEDGVADACGGA